MMAYNDAREPAGSPLVEDSALIQPNDVAHTL